MEANHVINYTKEDFTQNGRLYDAIVGVNGYRPLSAYKRALASGGKYIMVGGKPRQIFGAMLLGPLMSGGGKKLGGVSAKASQTDLLALKDLIKAGKITPVIERRFPLSETAEALRYLGAGHARAKVVITMASEEAIDG